MFLCRIRPTFARGRHERHRQTAPLSGGDESPSTEVKDQAKVLLCTEIHQEGTS